VRALRRQRLSMVIASIVVEAVALWAAVVALGTPSNQCDNMAGTCIHERQQAAILAVKLACLAAVALPLVVSFITVRRLRPSIALATSLLLLSASVAILTIATDPIHHLNNRWDGWLGSNP
jgi:hypothetical protein